MANARGTGTPRFGVIRPATRTPVVEEIVPNSGWTEDSAGHYLLVDLPEFKKEDVKLQVDSRGRIVVKGERQASEQKHVYFQLSFPAPVDSEIDKIAGKFDGGILYVTIPKQIQHKNKESDTKEAGIGSVERAEENDSHKTNADEYEGRELNQHVGHEEHQHVGHEEHQHVDHEEHEGERHENAQMGDFSEQVIRKWDQEFMLRSAVNVLRKNKGIVVTAVIAFSLGMYVSSKFQFSEAP